MKTIIKKYIRDPETKQPRGIAVAVKTDDKINYGFSLINPKADKWNKKIGTAIAVNRAMSDQYNLPAVKDREQVVLDAFENLQNRAVKYFKDLPYEDIALAGHLGFEDVNL
jgi:ABC-type xylose transport system substrate-binding protein